MILPMSSIRVCCIALIAAVAGCRKDADTNAENGPSRKKVADEGVTYVKYRIVYPDDKVRRRAPPRSVLERVRQRLPDFASAELLDNDDIGVLLKVPLTAEELFFLDCDLGAVKPVEIRIVVSPDMRERVESKWPTKWLRLDREVAKHIDENDLSTRIRHGTTEGLILVDDVNLGADDMVPVYVKQGDDDQQTIVVGLRPEGIAKFQDLAEIASTASTGAPPIIGIIVDDTLFLAAKLSAKIDGYIEITGVHDPERLVHVIHCGRLSSGLRRVSSR